MIAEHCIADSFFAGAFEKLSRLSDAEADRVATYVQGGAKNNPLIDVDWITRVETLLRNHDVRTFEFDLIRGGVAEHSRRFLDSMGRPSARAIAEAMKEGATLRLFGVSRFDPTTSVQAQMLRRALGRETFVNMYLTPPHSPGVQVHYDLEDSLAVQLQGSKTWRLYENWLGPAYPMRFDPANSPRSEPEKASRVVTLRRSDVLYVPQGVVHEVETLDEFSIHVTFGIRVIRMTDVLSSVVEKFAAEDAPMRRPLRGDASVTAEAIALSLRKLATWSESRGQTVGPGDLATQEEDFRLPLD